MAEPDRSGSDSLAATPAKLFVNPSGNNFQELSTSPSIGAGTSTDARVPTSSGTPARAARVTTSDVTNTRRQHQHLERPHQHLRPHQHPHPHQHQHQHQHQHPHPHQHQHQHQHQHLHPHQHQHLHPHQRPRLLPTPARQHLRPRPTTPTPTPTSALAQHDLHGHRQRRQACRRPMTARFLVTSPQPPTRCPDGSSRTTLLVNPVRLSCSPVARWRATSRSCCSHGTPANQGELHQPRQVGRRLRKMSRSLTGIPKESQSIIGSFSLVIHRGNSR